MVKAGVRALLLLSAALFAAHAAEARLEVPNPLVPGVTAEGKVVVENAPSRIVNLKLPDNERIAWQILRGGMTSTQIVNGVVSKSETIRITVRVSGEGPLTIAPVTVTCEDGTLITTNAVDVGVNQGNASLVGEAQAEISFEPNSIVPGEQTNVVYKLFLRGSRGVSNITVPELPKAFSLGDKQVATGETIDSSGVSWKVITVRWPVTFAEPGDHSAAGQIAYVTEIDSWPFPQQVRKQVAAKPATLTVLPLPSAGRPADFSGLIGPITVQAKLLRDRISSGEGTALEVSVQGRQVDFLPRPTLPAIAGMQSYPRDTPANEQPAGTRVFAWDLVPSAPGEFPIPPFSIIYFDPVSRQYSRADTGTLRLIVMPGLKRELTVSGNTDKTITPALPVRPVLPDLPAPVHGAATAAPRPILHWFALAAAAVLSAACGLLNRAAARGPRGPHRGRVLAKAVRSGDLAAIAHALQTLSPALRNDEQRVAARNLGEAVEVARFGSRPLAADVATKCVSTLGRVP
jgi:hypothetical protein